MTKDEFIKATAKLIAGLQVPRSLPMARQMLGTGLEPWDELHNGLTGFGWFSAEDCEEAIRKVLDE